MARRVFFSFHYENDVWRVSQVRNSWVTQGGFAGFADSADWESLRKGGDRAVQSWIDEQMRGTSVTVVLIGEHTALSKWVHYEILQSIDRKKGIIGVRIHRLKNQRQQSGRRGPNPLDEYDEYDEYGGFPEYDWVTDDGYSNLSDWVDDAAWQVGR
jgi:hypothetical protein